MTVPDDETRVTRAEHDQLIVHLGNMTYNAARVEATAHEIARCLNLEPGTQMVSTVLTAISECASTVGLPSWAHEVDGPSLSNWAARAIATLNRRNGVVHSLMALQRTESGTRHVHRQLRGSDFEALPPDRVEALALDLAAIAREGSGLQIGLMYEFDASAFVRLGAFPPPADDAEAAKVDRLHQWMTDNGDPLHYRGPVVPVRKMQPKKA